MRHHYLDLEVLRLVIDLQDGPVGDAAACSSIPGTSCLGSALDHGSRSNPMPGVQVITEVAGLSSTLERCTPARRCCTCSLLCETLARHQKPPSLGAAVQPTADGCPGSNMSMHLYWRVITTRNPVRYLLHLAAPAAAHSVGGNCCGALAWHKPRNIPQLATAL